MIEELATVVLVRNMAEHGLMEGDIGVVVHKYGNGTAYEVEFIAGDGSTVAVATVESLDIRLMQKHDILHVRQLAA